VWYAEEVDSLIQDEKMREVIKDYYDISYRGNWEEEKNVLRRKQSVDRIAGKHSLSEKEVMDLVSKAKSILFEARDTRVQPGLDDKILTSWNALMINGYLDAYHASGIQEYLDKALTNGRFLESNMINDGGRLDRNYKEGKSTINAFLDDYALTINAFVNLYQSTFDEGWLSLSNDLMTHTIDHFFDPETGMFFYTSDLDPPLITRKMVLGDNVIPGSNSSIARALHKLGLYYYNQDYLDKAQKMLNNIMPNLIESGQPGFYSNWCGMLLDQVNPPYEIAIVGQDFGTPQKALLGKYLPNKILLGGPDEGSLELLKEKLQDGETLIYVCQNKVCKFPVSDPDKAMDLME
ncbi:MAG: thioredoxin domain-containing protein, partial [Saprospiraceae bacterium]|nr:thioredoxin domain-containing protein [Saprospiraceae bacterium]